MSSIRFALAAVALVSALAACGHAAVDSASSSDGLTLTDQSLRPVRDSPDGTWEISEGVVDGLAVPELEGLFLEVDGNEFTASGACNGFGGPFDGDIFSQMAGCLDESLDRNAIDELMIEAFSNGPIQQNNQVVFSTDDIRLVYDAFDVPPLAGLFPQVADERYVSDDFVLGAMVDLPERAFPVGHTATDVVLHLAATDDFIALYWSTNEGAASVGFPLHSIARGSYAHELRDVEGYLGVRAALVPDTVASAPELQALGVIENNVLVVDESIDRATVTVARPDGGMFTLEVYSVTAPTG